MWLPVTPGGVGDEGIWLLASHMTHVIRSPENQQGESRDVNWHGDAQRHTAQNGQ